MTTTCLQYSCHSSSTVFHAVEAWTAGTTTADELHRRTTATLQLPLLTRKLRVELNCCVIPGWTWCCAARSTVGMPTAHRWMSTIYTGRSVSLHAEITPPQWLWQCWKTQQYQSRYCNRCQTLLFVFSAHLTLLQRCF